MEGDVMRMRAVPDGLEIKPGNPVKLEPNGYHLMFLGLQQPFKPGETVKATLTFQKAGSVEVEFKVEAVGFSPAAAHQH
jgi:copper(I)-binding protein